MPLKISPENYVLPLGKYKGLYAKDAVKIVVVDKDGKEKKEGLRYMKWLIDQPWFRDTEIIKKLISDAEGDIADDDHYPTGDSCFASKEAKHEAEYEVPKKKKNKDQKETKTVKISRDEESKTLNFQYISIK